MDWEAELAVVVGTTVRHADEAAAAAAAIAGYAVLNDVTARDWQYRDVKASSAHGNPPVPHLRCHERGGTTTSATPSAVTAIPMSERGETRSPKSRYASTATAGGTR